MRASPRRLLKSLFVATVVILAIINMNLLIRSGDSGGGEGGDIRVTVQRELDNREASSQGGNNNNNNNNNRNKPVVDNRTRPLNVTHPKAKSVIPEFNRTEVNHTVSFINSEQKVHNIEKFPLNLTQDSVVIVVQIHNRWEYLHHLLSSFRKVKDISKTLLILSHDYLSTDLQHIVQSIDFCPVIQIFYPYLMQVYEREFPGTDPNDCPRDINKEKAKIVKCNNADHPDKYGHYREARFSQTKHHWFWKINRVFDELDITKDFQGQVVLLEEDHYVTPDFVHVLQRMNRLRSSICQDCSILTLGTYDKNPTYTFNSGKVEIGFWVSSKHNMGMALNREVWNRIKPCAEQFCKFDDYNWDWSLQFVSATCYPQRMKVMLSKSPRVFHIGECGVHHKGKNCNPQQRVDWIEGLLRANKDHLFPNDIGIGGQFRLNYRVPKPNGGWGDLRDHQLCLHFAGKSQSPTSTKAPGR